MTGWKVTNVTLEMWWNVTVEVPPECRTPTEHPDYHTIQPERLHVVLSREKEAQPWGVMWVTLTGPRILKRGNVGVTNGEHIYTDKDLHRAPPEIQLQVALIWADAEFDRTGNRPTVPTDEDVFGRPPTPADVRVWPDYFIGGPGYVIARRTECGHGYHLTDSCPNCDAEEENSATPVPPAATGRSGIQRCDAYATRGAGSGICDRVLDGRGYCDRAGEHIEEGGIK